MKRIPLRNRQKQIVAYALVDDDDYENISQYTWCLNNYGYVRRVAHLETRTEARLAGRKSRRSKTVYMHREILQCSSAHQIDHINHDKLDNRKSNLRVTTPAENSANTPGRKGTSKYRGVSWSTKENKWLAFVQVNRKQYRVGGFADEKEAAEAAQNFRKANLPGSLD